MTAATVSVVIPVRNGAPWLAETLDALRAQAATDVLVIDSGSTDGSVGLAHHRGVRVLEIAPEEFGHGRTRKLGAGATRGEIVCFLTQDATPQPGWLDAFREAMSLDPAVGAAFGPHLPRSDTTPMIARELQDFFAGFAAEDGGPRLWPRGAAPFLSNVNACYRRACLDELGGFPDVPYAEDQAFARALAQSDWRLAYHPGAAVLHAHRYGPLTFMRRYFDEYRGLRATTGHVEGFGVRSSGRAVRAEVAADRRWMREQGVGAPARAAWTARAALHHGGRRLASALGSRAERLPEWVQRAASLEGTARGEPTARQVGPGDPLPWNAVLRIARDGPAPLLTPVPGTAERDGLHVAVVIPPFRRGSGGHSTIYNLLTRLEDRGHTVTTWVHDPLGAMDSEWPARIRGDLREFFRPPAGPVFKGFSAWFGCDVAVATGWETVHPVLALDLCRARAYLVQDHEPEFFATSAQRLWAEQTYAADLHPIAASPWLAELVQARLGRPASCFDLAVDHEVYRPLDLARRDDTVIFYCRDATPRRGGPLGLLALAELARRRPGTRFVLYGDPEPTKTPFAHEHLGIATPAQLATEYCRATVGLSLSLTNYSLIPQEMLACGLPCVEVAGRSLEGVYGEDGALLLVPPDPVKIADALERLLDDPAECARRADAGREAVRGRTWERASIQVEEGLREALRLREQSEGPTPRASRATFTPSGARSALGPPAFDPDARAVPIDLGSSSEATDALYERLDPADVQMIEAAMDADERDRYAAASDDERRRLALVYGVWHQVPVILEKTGLQPDLPPDDVHAMARGPRAAGGSLYYADMLCEALRGAGRTLWDVRRGLDFGCSSGRVVRALAAVHTSAEWHGCDPNAGAIDWAREHLPGIAFARSPTDPPLAYPEAHFDLVAGISIWSHYAEDAASGWLAEMARIVEPGGTLVITTHGPQSVAHYAATGERAPGQLAEVRSSLYRRGFWFAPEFGEQGDWGVRHPQWGTAFLTAEWLLRACRRDWIVQGLQVGQNAGNQDVYVLTRRSTA